MSGTRLLVAFYDVTGKKAGQKTNQPADDEKAAERVAFERNLQKGIKQYEKRTGLVARSCYINQGFFSSLCPPGDNVESLTVAGIVVEGRPWVRVLEMLIGEDV